MKLNKKIRSFIIKNDLIPDGSTIVLGFSGGPDSMFLLHYLATIHHEKKIKLIAAHLDHQWRKESPSETLFCKKVAEKLNVPFISTKISKLGVKFAGSKEEIGRKYRRYFLEKILEENKANYIALAHHLQDQEETFFIRLIRGSSLSGLTSMWPKSGVYIRPLLNINKKDILDYLKKEKIKYITDPSNESMSFLRNRIRKTVILSLKECDSRFDTNFLSTLEKLQNAESFLDKITKKTFEEINDNLKLNIKKFLILDPYIQYRVILYWLCKEKVSFTITYKFLDEILRFLKQPEGKEHKIHHEWSIVKKHGFFYIKKVS